MTKDLTPYQPISCELHDLLEDLATTRGPVSIRFWDGSGVEQQRNARIEDVYANNGEEYIKTSSGDLVRLDSLIDVYGTAFAAPLSAYDSGRTNQALRGLK